MQNPNADFQLEFHDLLKNDLSVFQWISENVVNGIWYGNLNDPENLWISDSFWKTLGYSKSEKKSFRNLEEVLADSDGIKEFNLLKESANPDLSFETFFKFKSKNHKNVLLEGKAKIIKRVGEIDPQVLIIFTNVTHSEENLQLLLDENKSLKKINEVYDEANQLTRTGGWEIDLENEFLTWTRITKEIHEVAQDYEPTIEAGIHFYKEGESRDDISNLFQKAVEEGIPFDTELQLVTAKNNEIWVRAFGKPEMKNGKCVRLYGAFQDINNKKKREIEFQRNKDRFQQIFSNSPIGIILAGPQNQIIMGNPASYKIFGFTDKDTDHISKITFKDIIHPEDLSTGISYREKLLAGEIDNYKLELRFYNKQKEVLWCNVNTSIIRGDKGVEDLIITQVEDITLRKQLEKKAEETAGQFKNAFEFSPNGMAMVSLEGKWLKVNKILSQLLGYTQKEFLERSFNDVTHPEDVYTDLEMVKDLFSNRIKSYKIEKRYIHKNGNLVYGLISVSLLRDSEGNPLYFIAQINDISESVKAKEALKNSLNDLQTVMDATTQVAIIETDLIGNIVKFNKGAENLLGYSQKDIIGKKTISFLHDNNEIRQLANTLEFENTDALNEFEILTYNANKGILDSQECTYIRNDKSKFPVQLITTCVTTQSGKLIGYLFIATDISKLKSIESELGESEQRLHFALEGSGDGVWDWDIPNGRQYMSAQAKKMLGFEPEESLIDVEEWDNRIHPEEREKSQKALEDYFNNIAPVYYIEKRVLCKDGSYKWILDRGKIIEWDSLGEPLRMIGTQSNISERKEMENSLIKAKLKAESANKSKSEFLANMSHEIRTPLNGVIGFTDLLMKTELNSSQKQYMKTVYNSANSLLDLINDILDFSKIEAGKLEISVEKTDLLNLCGQTIDIIKHQAHDKNLEVLLNISSDINRFIYADAVRIRQIITNLLGNAVKFTESGEVELKIDAVPVAGSEDEMIYTFIIRDTGIGIAPNNLKRIFNAFDQEDSSTTRKYGGTGLGLTISNKLLGLMDSKLELSSKLGVGSEFSFQLQIKTEKGDNSLQENSKKINKVLVIDDNENNRIILQEMLAIGNIETQLVSNGIKALQALEKNNDFDLAIVDYNMPYMNGVELIGHIRKKLNFSSEDLPLILLHSSADDEKIHQACRDLKVQFNITKPIQIDQLFNMLKNIKAPQAESSLNELVHRIEETDIVFNILIAEDNPVNKFLAKTIIKKALPNCNILEADDGQEAVNMFKTEEIDLIFMDVQMPILSGFEATQEIRELEKDGEHLPIIALTARTVKGERERCQEFGIDDYITKPVVFNTISDIIKKHLLLPSKQKQAEIATSNVKNSLHFDKKELMEKLEGDDEGYAELMEMVRANLIDIQNKLDIAIEADDIDSVRNVAHALKGSSLNCCFHTLKDLSLELEHIKTQEKSVLLTRNELIKKEIHVVLGLI